MHVLDLFGKGFYWILLQLCTFWHSTRQEITKAGWAKWINSWCMRWVLHGTSHSRRFVRFFDTGKQTLSGFLQEKPSKTCKSENMMQTSPPYGLMGRDMRAQNQLTGSSFLSPLRPASSRTWPMSWRRLGRSTWSHEGALMATPPLGTLRWVTGRLWRFNESTADQCVRIGRMYENGYISGLWPTKSETKIHWTAQRWCEMDREAAIWFPSLPCLGLKSDWII